MPSNLAWITNRLLIRAFKSSCYRYPFLHTYKQYWGIRDILVRIQSGSPTLHITCEFFYLTCLQAGLLIYTIRTGMHLYSFKSFWIRTRCQQPLGIILRKQKFNEISSKLIYFYFTFSWFFFNTNVLSYQFQNVENYESWYHKTIVHFLFFLGTCPETNLLVMLDPDPHTHIINTIRDPQQSITGSVSNPKWLWRPDLEMDLETH
jgi:hypothetical protein